MSEVLSLVRRRFWVNRATGLPVTPQVGQEKQLVKAGKRQMLLANPCVMTNLLGRPNFYMVVGGDTGKGVVISDGAHTLFLWLGGDNDHNLPWAIVKCKILVPTASEEQAVANFRMFVGDAAEGNGKSVMSFKLKDFANRNVICVHTA